MFACRMTFRKLRNNNWTDTFNWAIHRGQNLRCSNQHQSHRALPPHDHRPRRPRPRPHLWQRMTAYVAEQWGRRWITIDTSRAAISLMPLRVAHREVRLFTRSKIKKQATKASRRGPASSIRPSRTSRSSPSHRTRRSIRPSRWEPVLAEKLAELQRGTEGGHTRSPHEAPGEAGRQGADAG